MKCGARCLLIVAMAILTGTLGFAHVAGQSRQLGLVINEDGNSIATLDPATGAVVASNDISDALSKPHLAAYDAATKRLYVGSKGSRLAAFDLSDPLAPKLLTSVKPGGDGEIHWVVLAAGLVWLAHQGDSAIYAYDPGDLSQPVVRLGKEFGFDTTHGLALRPGTNELWTTNRPDDAPGFVLRIDARTRKVVGEPLATTGKAGDRPNNTAFTPDGRLAYVVNTGSDATEITVIDAETFSIVKQIVQDRARGLAPHAIVFDPATRRMFVANKDGGTLSAIDVASDTVVGYAAVGEEPHGVTIGPDGLVYVTAKHDNKIVVIDPVALTLVREIGDPSFVGPHQILFLPTGA
jgi:DNA-binding beta-propeller fold protein YncE